MKHFFSREKPDCLVEDWPGKFDTFSWLEFGITVPNPIFIVTSLKEGNIPNANLQSWGLLLGEGKYNHFLLALLKHQHTYSNILRTKEWCVNYISKEFIDQSFETIQKNDVNTDEISSSGFTMGKSKIIKSPFIEESKVCLECELSWEKSVIEDSKWSLLCGKIVNIIIDDSVFVVEPEKRIEAMNLMYNIRSIVNPLNGDYYGPNTIGIINEVIRYFDDTGKKRV
jgi:flavin reductase (DIM6/NTAB) family NADH-FMN oxidoreductase RutF